MIKEEFLFSNFSNIRHENKNNIYNIEKKYTLLEFLIRLYLGY